MPICAIALYLVAALAGGIIPAKLNSIPVEEQGEGQTVVLLGTLLHVDIAIPLTEASRSRFGFLRDHGFPLDDPQLKYIVVGWGSRAFYPATANYSDITLSNVWTALTGDKAVLHFAPAGDLSRAQGVSTKKLSPERVEKLLLDIENTLSLRDNQPILLRDKGYGFGDLFYEAKGWFHLFNPCNVWVSEMLSGTGLATGIWTPTAYSLWVNDYLYN